MTRKQIHNYDIEIIKKLRNEPYRYSFSKIAELNNWPRCTFQQWFNRNYIETEGLKTYQKKNLLCKPDLVG